LINIGLSKNAPIFVTHGVKIFNFLNNVEVCNRCEKWSWTWNCISCGADNEWTTACGQDSVCSKCHTSQVIKTDVRRCKTCDMQSSNQDISTQINLSSPQKYFASSSIIYPLSSSSLSSTTGQIYINLPALQMVEQTLALNEENQLKKQYEDESDSPESSLNEKKILAWESSYKLCLTKRKNH